ncbi:hypothetical protein PAESOLCIP111_02523 [Paenibacillus solanacearum]|uniref:Pectate lyase n=1 Tax=Paenibacillus solanacearum TaxID=2048548 RepID=A0A916K164_9BACL|nr:pectate lyase [Paenibacillus solanacearum]CAG7623449.1 hypothetical protein PAESOLCIP111_02523 [Paenibacillus solanacearum]
MVQWKQASASFALKYALLGGLLLCGASLTVTACLNAASRESKPAASGEADADRRAPVIVKAETAGTHAVEVTFSEKLNPFVAADVKLVAAAGSWYELNPKLTRFLTVEHVQTRTNERNQTVAVFTVSDRFHPDGSLVVPESRDPAKLKLLTDGYDTGIREANVKQADRLLTWQLDHGGWYKNMQAQYARPWNGTEKRSDLTTKSGVEIGEIDNGATTSEMVFLSIMYDQTKDDRYKQAVRKAIGFLLTMQYASGGWPQVYPARGNYSDEVTFNDNAMTRVMETLRLVAEAKYPFDTDIVDSAIRRRAPAALDRGLDYILKSQIVADGKLTGWCGQHDPVTYAPRQGRPYEHPSVYSAETAAVVQYLMSVPNPPEAVSATVKGALEWLEAARVKGMKYDTRTPIGSNFVADAGSSVWYRFYEIGTNLPVFSGRDGVIKRNLLDIEDERRNGYSWGGTWPAPLLRTAAATGYYENRVYVQTVGGESLSASKQSLPFGQLVKIVGGVRPE